MSIRKPINLTQCRRFFLEPEHPKQRQYEALRAFYAGELSSREAADAFGYSHGAFRVLCHQFRRTPDPQFFLTTRTGPQRKPKKSLAQTMTVAMRKKNYSIYEISEALKDKGVRLSPTAVGEVLKEEGFAPLPRRLDEERPEYPRPTIEPVANVRAFSLAPCRFTTRCGGLFLFIPDMIKLGLERIARRARLPGSKMIPSPHALRACLSLKLWSIERKSHVMALVSDQGLALFCGLNVMPKKSYLTEYSSPIDAIKTMRLLAVWHDLVSEEDLFTGESINLDFHSVPYFGEHPTVEKHYVSKRSRRQPSILVFLAQDADAGVFCYSNADIRKGEEPEEIFRFIKFWKRKHGDLPRHLVFDSRLTTLANLARLDRMEIVFITLRRRDKKWLDEIDDLPRSAWRKTELDVPTRKYRWPRYYEQTVKIEDRKFRQLYIKDLGHDDPTILLTNEKRTAKKLITRYAQRMLIENAIADAVRFFHMDALSSSVGLKIDFDMALLVIASGLYRLMARRMRGYRDAQARRIFRDLLDIPADVQVTNEKVIVRFHRRAHLPIVMASGLLDKPVKVPWWGGLPLLLTT